MINTLVLIGFIILLFLGGLVRAFIKGDFTDKNEELLKEIKNELKKENNEAKKGKVIQ